MGRTATAFKTRTSAAESFGSFSDDAAVKQL